MTGVLLSRGFVARFGDRLNAACAAAGLEPDVVHLPDDPRDALDAAACGRIRIAYLTRDIRFSPLYETFGAAVTAAPRLEWVHFASAGIDQHPFLAALRARGVRLTTSSGTNAEPVAQTAITGLLMLARRFPHWLAAQRDHRWAPMRGNASPADVRGQTVLVVGVGAIGGAIARFCQAVGMHVIGMRRTPRQPGDPVDEMQPGSALREVLPRCQWVVLACPLTDETRRMLNAETLALLPRGAHVVNVARGGCIDEPALVAALCEGRLGGAYLDVFETEPLPAASPLWDLPNVIVSPHSAAVSDGNDKRAADIFFGNIARWARRDALENERSA
ncbi:MAG TPA: D-2-hydroxyacid dehydrogenase [Burkholderiales bacterium]|nr:D-2-hydroxyacid dehydrogenase [Burkholderiales bacterium]